MALRALWKGIITFENLEVPVKLFTALEDRTVHFRLLHRSDKEPVSQKMVDRKNGREVPSEKRRKGVELESGRFVMLDDEDLRKLEPEPSRIIAVNRFVHLETLGHQWYDRPYYLGPDGDASAYWGLFTALEEKRVEGICRWTMRNKEYLGSLRSEYSCLTLTTLRFADQVISPSLIHLPRFRSFEKKEVEMARRLIHMLADDFNPQKYHDQYRSKVMELIGSKSQGAQVQTRKSRIEKKETASLGRALEASLASVKEREDG